MIVNDDRWYTKPTPLFLPKGQYCRRVSNKIINICEFPIEIRSHWNSGNGIRWILPGLSIFQLCGAWWIISFYFSQYLLYTCSHKYGCIILYTCIRIRIDKELSSSMSRVEIPFYSLNSNYWGMTFGWSWPRICPWCIFKKSYALSMAPIPSPVGLVYTSKKSWINRIKPHASIYIFGTIYCFFGRECLVSAGWDEKCHARSGSSNPGLGFALDPVHSSCPVNPNRISKKNR